MNITKLLALLKDTICTECGLVWGEAGAGCDDCRDIRSAMAEPAPPSALSGVSAEELRELSYRVRGYRGGNTCGASERIASILRALAESMEGGKG